MLPGMAWEASEKNRDLLYADLIKLVDKKICQLEAKRATASALQLKEEIDKIKAVLNPFLRSARSC